MKNSTITLHTKKGRKYLNAANRWRFIKATETLPARDRLVLARGLDRMPDIREPCSVRWVLRS
jgi:hypothetical protein